MRANPGPVSPWLQALVKSHMSAPHWSTVVITPTFQVSVMIKPVDTYHLMRDKAAKRQAPRRISLGACLSH